MWHQLFKFFKSRVLSSGSDMSERYLSGGSGMSKRDLRGRDLDGSSNLSDRAVAVMA